MQLVRKQIGERILGLSTLIRIRIRLYWQDQRLCQEMLRFWSVR